MIVVKLGGSLAEGGGLRAALAALAGAGGVAVVVPGGGGFADAVRAAQRAHGFSDSAAHEMALLAMEQHALMLADLAQGWVPCRTIAEIRSALAAARVPVWLPSAMALADRDLPQSWEVTSDSLAAWLARRLEARLLVLVKSVAAPLPLDPAALAAEGLVDPLFPRFLAASRVALDWAGPGDAARLRGLVAASSR